MNYFVPNPQNYYMYNPINPNDQLWWGVGYPYEIFYKIDFFNIKKDSYIISSYGRIFSLNTMKETSPITHNNGYLNIVLVMEKGYGDLNNRKAFKIHKLVAMAFIVKTEEDYALNRDIPNHKNLIRNDNHVWNLEWVNEQENRIHAIQNKATYFANLPQLFTQLQPRESQWGIGSAKGDRNGKSRLTEEQVHTICRSLQEGKTPKECCELIGEEWNDYNSSLINNILHGRRRQDISSQYNLTAVARPQFDYSSIEPMIMDLILQGFSNKQVYEQIKHMIPYHPGEEDKKHYDRVRIKIGNIKKKIL